MSNAEKSGRSTLRTYTANSFAGRYNDTGSLAALEALHSKLKSALETAGAKEIVYDEEATAHTEKRQKCDPRTEPIMLHRWKGDCHGKEATCDADGLPFDTEGLNIIVRGRSRLQKAIKGLIKIKPDQRDSTNNREIFVYGCKA